MARLCWALMLILTLFACSQSKDSESKKDLSQKREYEYAETVEERELRYEKPSRKIVASSDTAAFAIAFRNFCIDKALFDYEVVEDGHTDRPLPISFKIYDDTGADVTSAIITDDEEEMKIIEDRMNRIHDEVYKKYVYDRFD